MSRTGRGCGPVEPCVGGSVVETRVYNTPGVFTDDVPDGVVGGWVAVAGAAGGGGSGRRGAAGSVRCGGQGGAPGGFVRGVWIDAAAWGDSYTVTIAAGGTGGAAVTADDTNGNPGTR